MASGQAKRPGRACARAAILAALAACALAAPAAAGPPQSNTVEAFDLVFRGWMRRHHVARGVLAVSYANRLALVKGYGGIDPAAPVPLASLAKAITGACLATLVRDKKLSFDAKLGDVLGAFFRRHGEPADPRVRAITIEQLLAHRSGFSRHANPDPASGPALVAHLRTYGSASPHVTEAVKRALAYRLARAPGQTYEYVNVNYLLLGAAIEEVSGRAYETYCRDALLKPLGVTHGRLGKWAALSAYGGWSLSGAEYLAFLHAFDRDSRIMDAATRRWLASPAGKQFAGRGDLAYSLGVVARREPGGVSVWHTGLWTHAQKDVRGGALADSHATLAVKSAKGAAWFVYMEPQLPLAARAELDAALWRAAEQVKAWPAQDLFARYGVGIGKEQKTVPVAAPLKTGDAGKSDDRPHAARN
ncbi:MAG TPA: serine hydrolase domain-containing protein [Alphaproteobacteria bacterium]|jgi:CubicO group peptidase (beta-lactamase class C family)